MERIANDSQITGRTGRHPESIEVRCVLAGGTVTGESPDATPCVGVITLRDGTGGHATVRSCAGEATDQEHLNGGSLGSRIRSGVVCLGGRWKRGYVDALP